jgi:beta-phosphoglucomutase-like phosphatase (HAD superfamily)
MSGGLLTNALLRETGVTFDAQRIERLQRRHAEACLRNCSNIRDRWRRMRAARRASGGPSRRVAGWKQPAMLEKLGIDPRRVPVVTRDQVKYAKPDSDLFLAAADRLGVSIDTASVVGDSVWDMLAARRARAPGIGLQSGGYGSGTGARRRLSSLRRSCRPAEASRRSWRPAIAKTAGRLYPAPSSDSRS